MNKKRKVTKRIAAWFLCLAMVLTTINLPVFTKEVKAEEAPKCGENAYYAYDETTKTLRIYGSGSLYKYAFNVNYKSNLNNDEHRASIAREMKKVIIGKDITALSFGAFYGYGYEADATSSQLETVEFEEGSKITDIGTSAFYCCESLSSFSMPDSVKTLGTHAFNDCDSLASVTLSNNLETIGNNAFESCDKLENVVIPPSVTTIEGSAFAYCDNLLNISIANPLVKIGVNSLEVGYKLKNVHVSCSFDADTVGDGEEEENASLYWSMKGVYNISIVKKDIHDFSKYVSNKDGTHKVVCKDCGAIQEGHGKDACSGGTATCIEKAICEGCGEEYGEISDENHNFSEEFVNSTTKKLEATCTKKAMYRKSCVYCGELSTSDVFEYGEPLGHDYVYVSETEHKCSRCVAQGPHNFIPDADGVNHKCTVCDSKRNHNFSENGTCVCGITQIEYEVISDTEKTVLIIGPNTSIMQKGDLVIPSTVKIDGEDYLVTEIDDEAFWGCLFNGELTIGNNVKTIGNSAFYQCPFTGNLTIPNSVTTIGNEAFYQCPFTGNLTIPNSVTTINIGAFIGCEFSGDVIIPDSVTNIEDFILDLINISNIYSVSVPCLVDYDYLYNLGIVSSIITYREHDFAGGVCKVCGVCQAVVTQGNHDFSESEYKNDGKGKHYRICALCTSESEHEACSGGTATCQKKAVCSLCKNEYGDLAAHTWDAGTVTTPATCKTKGVKTFKCTVERCTGTKTEDIAIDASNHVNTEVFGKKDATCTEKGYTGDTHCKDCDETVTGTEIQATGHDMTKVVSAEVPATCEADGKEAVMGCKNCDHEEGGAVIPAKGHTWDAGTVTTPATCKTKGVKTFKCTVEGCTGTKTEEIVIDANNHVNKEVVGKKDATCTEKGYTGDIHCKDCDKTIAKGTEIAATGHTWDSGKVTTEPTVTAEGVKTFTCKDCGATKTETIAKLPAPKKNQVIEDKTGNDYKVADPAKKEVTYKAPANKKAKTVTIPASVKIDGVTYKVTKVDDKAFKGNTTVTKVVIPSSVTAIGAESFSGCKNLTTVSIPKNVTTIGKNAFKGCAKLTKLTLPSKCTKIGAGAFDGCKKMKTITIKSTKLTSKSVSANAFKGLSKNVTIKVPKKQLKAYKKLLKKKGFKGKVKA